MDYEKKYKEALERAKELYEKRNNSCFVQDQIKGEAALKIFPEIKENKDILKILIQIFQTQYRDSTYSAFPYEGLITGEEILAWLEKQGEQKPTWSEKDEEIFNTVITEGDLKPSEIQWFKSLKDRYTWKPSDEQMETLDLLHTDYVRCDD